MGHYCLFLSLINEIVTSYICDAFAKWNGRMIMTKDAWHRSDLGPAILLAWICTKYRLYFPLELLFYGFMLLAIPICALCSLRMTGHNITLLPSQFPNREFHPNTSICHWDYGLQWFITLFICGGIVMVTRALCWLMQTDVKERVFIMHLLLTLTCGFVLFSVCKQYVDIYVVPTKI